MAANLEIAIKAVDNASGVIAHIEKKAGGLGSTLGGVAGSIVGMGVKAALGLGAVGAAVTGLVGITGFGFNQLKQNAQIAFETMLGSGEKAKGFLDELQRFAAKTPFEFPELIQTSQKLLAMGFSAEKVVPTLTAIGDATAALGGGPGIMEQITRALGQMQAKGKASADEMLQLTEAGVPAWQFLADAIGTDVAGAMDKVSKGAVDADTVIGAMTAGMNAKFGGMMEKQSHTFGGLFSTLKDTFTQVSGTVMAPFFEMATKGMQKLADLSATEKFQEGVQKVADAVRTGLMAALRFLQTEGPKAWEFFKTEVLPRLISFASFVKADVVPIVVDMVRIFQEHVAPILQRVGEVVGKLMEKLDNKAVLIALIIIVGTLAAAFIGSNLAILGTIAAIAGLIAVALIIGGVASQIIDHWDQIKVLFAVTIPTAINSFLDKVREITIIGEIFNTAWENVKVIFETAFSFIQNRVQFFMDSIRAIILIVTSLIHGDWGAAWNGVKDLFNAFWTLIKTDIETAFTGVAGIISNALGGVAGVVGDIWNGVKGTILGAVNEIIGIFNALIDGINSMPDIHVSNPVGPDINIGIPDIPRIPTIGGGGGGGGDGADRYRRGPGLYQMGGIVRHALQLVGERGPELAALPIGSRVFTADQTREMVQGGRGGDIHLHIGNIDLGRGVNKTDVDDLMDMIEHAWSVRRWRGI